LQFAPDKVPAKAFLTTWWLTAGYHLLTVLFALLTAMFAYATLHR
jgi:hypothetical protein